LSTDSVFSLYLFLLSVPLLPCSTLFPYTTLFRAGFTWPGAWRAPHLAVPLVATLALPIVGLSARGFMPTIALVLALQIVFMLVDVFMEEATFRGLVLEALARYPALSRVLICSLL